MNVRPIHLVVRTRQTTEQIRFSETVTFVYGPVGTAKSTVVRLVDYCFGGDLERTPAFQQEFVSVVLAVKRGEYECTFEHGADDTQEVRITWTRGEDDFGSVNAPLSARQLPLLDGEVYNLSNLLFYLCGVDPIKVPKRSRDPDSPMIRFSFRDVWWYCYLEVVLLGRSTTALKRDANRRPSQLSILARPEEHPNHTNRGSGY